jgi:hypothetical protein
MIELPSIEDVSRRVSAERLGDGEADRWVCQWHVSGPYEYLRHYVGVTAWYRYTCSPVCVKATSTVPYCHVTDKRHPTSVALLHTHIYLHCKCTDNRGTMFNRIYPAP